VHVYSDDVAPNLSGGHGCCHDHQLHDNSARKGPIRSQPTGSARATDDRREGFAWDQALVRMSDEEIQGVARCAQRREASDDKLRVRSAAMTRGRVGSFGVGSIAVFVRANRALALAPSVVEGQVDSPLEVHTRFHSGQSITPILRRNGKRVPDGASTLVFGYLNRNHVEQFSRAGSGAQNHLRSRVPPIAGQPVVLSTRARTHFHLPL